MHIFIGADHGGFELKEELKQLVETSPGFSSQLQIEDLGAFSHNPTDDYPQFATAVAQKVTKSIQSPDQEPQTWGVLICRSGAGMAIAANRLPGVRAVVCRSKEDVVLTRKKNNANVLVLEGDHLDLDMAWQLLQTFLITPFDGGRHTARVVALG